MGGCLPIRTGSQIFENLALLLHLIAIWFHDRIVWTNGRKGKGTEKAVGKDLVTAHLSAIMPPAQSGKCGDLAGGAPQSIDGSQEGAAGYELQVWMSQG